MQVFLIVFVCFTSVTAENAEVVVRLLGGPRIAKIFSEEMGYYYKGPVSIVIIF